MSSQRQNEMVLTYWSLLHQSFEKLLAVENLSRRLQRLWENKHWKTICVAVVNRGESLQQNLLNIPVGRDETNLQTILVDHVKQISVAKFCGRIWKWWRESPKCWQWPVLAWTKNVSKYLTWWKQLQILWILSGSELLCWFETIFFGIEVQICQRTWLRYIRE